MNRKPTAENPFTLVIDLGKVYTANRLVIYSQAGRTDPQFPKALNLYASLDGTNYTLIDEYTDLTFSGNKQTVDFADTQMRYYKIEVTDSHSGYLIIRELEMWKVFEANGGAQITPDNPNLTFTGDWEVKQAFSTFGHVYVGKQDAELTFDFIGTRLGILTSSVFEANFEVYIDGEKVDSIALKADSGALTYLSDNLGSGTHRVVIKCTGEANIDSLVVFS